jgi:hypothetical protein
MPHDSETLRRRAAEARAAAFSKCESEDMSAAGDLALAYAALARRRAAAAAAADVEVPIVQDIPLVAGT